MKRLLRLCSHRKSRRELLSTSEASWATTKSVGMWKKPVDTTASELAALRRQMNAIQQELEALKNRKTTTVTKQGDKGGHPAGDPRAHAVHCACGAERRRR